MKQWFAILAFGVSLLVPPAGAQDKSNIAKAVPKVESADILDLNQNQAERTRDQPGNTAPTWRAITDGQKHYSSLPAPEAGILIQRQARFPGQDRAVTAGEAWRRYHNGPLTQIGVWLLAIAAGACALVYIIKGPIRVGAPRTGRLIERFTPIERIVHWTVAISFVTMAITGLVMLFGKYVLLPVFGHTLLGWVSYALKNIHNFVGPIFAVSIVVFFVIYVRSNLPEKTDFQWLTHPGHVKSGRFNTFEKLWFWGGLTLLGLIVSASGLALDMLLPGIEYTRRAMQLSNIIHVLGTSLMMAGAIAHIYLGTIGTEGAYEGMRTGYVDDAWAKANHPGWYEQVENGEIPRERSSQETPPFKPV